MGYDVHITRKEEWFDEDGEKISLEEWINFVNSSSDMRLDNYAEADTPTGTLRVESDGLAVWVGYSGHEKDGNMAWFDYYKGEIIVKNPDVEILKKMHQIAQALNAKVQGDEAELYDDNGEQIRGSSGSNEQDHAEQIQVEKKWWQFWK